MISIENRFDEPRLLSWDNEDRFGVPDLVHPELKALVKRFIDNDGQGRETLEIKTSSGTFKVEIHVEKFAGGSRIPSETMTIANITDQQNIRVINCEGQAHVDEPHYGELVHESYYGMGVSSLVRTILDKINGVLPTDFTQKTDRFLFLLRRGYVPQNELVADDIKALERAITTRTVERLSGKIPLTYDPEQARPLWDSLMRTNK